MKDETSQLFNRDWKFLLGDPKDASDPKNAEQEYYCDSTWKRVDLPHDWVIHQPFDKGEDGGWTKQVCRVISSGKIPVGTGRNSHCKGSPKGKHTFTLAALTVTRQFT